MALPSLPGQEKDPTGVDSALATAEYLENTRQAGLPSPPAKELTPEPFRGLPTSLADFRMIPATLTPDAAPTKIYGDPALVLGEATWTDSFDDSIDSRDGDNACARLEINQERLHAVRSGADGEFCTLLVQASSPDYYLQVNLEPPVGCVKGEFGLFFRGTREGEGSYFGRTCEGNSRVVFESRSGSGVLLAEGSAGISRILPGLPDEIGILARGDRVALYANGILLGEVQDPLYPDGAYFGLFVRSAGGSPFSAAFDNLAYWDLSDLTDP
jgi:hypothetical protein